MLQGFPAIGIIDLALDLRALGILPAIAVRPGLHRLGVVRRWLIAVCRGAERRAEDFEIAEADLAAFRDADKGTAFPSAAGVGGVADPELLLLDQRDLHLHFRRAVKGRAGWLRCQWARREQATG